MKKATSVLVLAGAALLASNAMGRPVQNTGGVKATRAQTTPSVMDATLYDNGPLVTHPGSGCSGGDASALQTALTNNIYGYGWTGAFRLSDDFVVPAGQTWNVTGFEFFAYLTNATAPSYTTVTIEIWNGAPGSGGASVIAGNTTTNRLAPPATFTNTYRPLDTSLGDCFRRVQRLQCNLAATLPAGTYWITFGGGPSGFMPPVTLLGQPGKPGGNGMQFNAAWAPILDAGVGQDLPFLVIGSVGGGCYPDCDGNGTLNVNDYICFQTKFALGDPYADCDNNGVRNVNDYICFQTKFALGC